MSAACRAERKPCIPPPGRPSEPAARNLWGVNTRFALRETHKHQACRPSARRRHSRSTPGRPACDRLRELTSAVVRQPLNRARLSHGPVNGEVTSLPPTRRGRASRIGKPRHEQPITGWSVLLVGMGSGGATSTLTILPSRNLSVACRRIVFACSPVSLQR
jgi:hypothetical protein